MNALTLISAAAVLVGQASAALQWQRTSAAIVDERFGALSCYAIAMEGEQYPFLYNDGNILGAGFTAYARSGDSLGGNTFGAYYDRLLAPTTASSLPPQTSTKSNYPGFSSLKGFGETGSVSVDRYNYSATGVVTGPFPASVSTNILYSVTGFEDSLPSPVYLTTIQQESENGTLTALATEPVDTSSVDGILAASGGAQTATGTHLGTESKLLDAKTYISTFVDATVTAMKKANPVFNVMNYGFVWEATVTPGANPSASIVKHYVMGRAGVSSVIVMPDQKTVYMASEGNGKPILMFKATTAGNFAAGSLYALKVGAQTGTGAVGASGPFVPGTEAAFLAPTWILLGSSTDTAIKALRTQTSKTIWKTIVATKLNKCTAPAKIVRNDLTGKPECATLSTTNANAKLAAAFLDTNRYAAYLGATVDWSSIGDFALDTKRNVLYFSIGSVAGTMLKVTTDGLLDTIKLTQNLCGMIFKMPLNGTFVGTSILTPLGDSIQPGDKNFLNGFPNKNFVSNTYVTGTPITSYKLTAANQPAYNTTNDLNFNLNNACDISNIANPGPLSYIPNHDHLVIGEDTSYGHQNDMLWVWNLNYVADAAVVVPPAAQYNYNPTQITRIATAPFGSEWASVNWIDNLNGFAYLTATVQHPYTEDSTSRLASAPASSVPAFEAYVGYIGHNLAYQYYLEVGQVGGFPAYGQLCSQGSNANDPVCDDGNVLTQDTCGNNGVDYFWTCSHTALTAAPCTSDAACVDSDPCNLNACIYSQGLPPTGAQVGNCQAFPGNPSCTPCNSTAPCNDGNVCTVDICTNGRFSPTTGDPIIATKGVCQFIQPYGAESNSSLCTSCTPANAATACNDGQSCTFDKCSSGLSTAVGAPGGVAAGVCTSVYPFGDFNENSTCAACTSAATCNDGDDCTDDDCVAPDAFGNFNSVGTSGAAGICVSTRSFDCEACTVSSTCDVIDLVYPYDPSQPIGFANVTFPNLPNYAATPYCLTQQCINKRCQPNTDLSLGSGCKCGGTSTKGFAATAGCPSQVCKIASCALYGNTCVYTNAPDTTACGAGKTCTAGVCA